MEETAVQGCGKGLYLHQLRKLLIPEGSKVLAGEGVPCGGNEGLLTQLFLNFPALFGREPSDQLSLGIIESCHVVDVEQGNWLST